MGRPHSRDETKSGTDCISSHEFYLAHKYGSTQPAGCGIIQDTNMKYYFPIRVANLSNVSLMISSMPPGDQCVRLGERVKPAGRYK